ncbi:hypothetical protein DV706_18380 (plasmid) [Natronorubrum bangense]|uniref:Uncharacterized protein n=3 Tax=Natronorubrum bangense TaxID=61858 RepID=L9W8F0_9EURY|nr:hypothetical protein C494_15213 [Natronorubrum bangense JCM 10635]QCC56481.1 hypothetical protein DV706_18380 [Natronorubrum bangense]
MKSERDLQRDVQTLREMKQGHEHWIREYDDEFQRIRKSAQESKRVYDEWVREFERDPSNFMEEYHIPDPTALVAESLEDD